MEKTKARNILLPLIITVIFIVSATIVAVEYQHSIDLMDAWWSGDFSLLINSPLFKSILLSACCTAFLWIVTLRLTKYKRLTTVIIGIAFLISGVAMLGFAWRLQGDIARLNNDLATGAGRGATWVVITLRDSAIREVPLYVCLGAINILLAVLLFISPKLPRQTFTVDSVQIMVSTAILLIAAISSVITVDAHTDSPYYAQLLLNQPTNALGIYGRIYVYYNYIDSGHVDSLIDLVRVDKPTNRYEYIECGIIQDSTGVYICGATKLANSSVTTVKTYTQVTGQGMSWTGSSYFNFWIIQTENNHFVAEFAFPPAQSMSTTEDNMPIRPPDDSVTLIDITFEVGGDNHYEAGSTTNNQQNIMRGHYASLSYMDSQLQWHNWSDVKIWKLIPTYDVTLVMNCEFYTSGGYGTPMKRFLIRYHGAGGGYITLLPCGSCNG